MKVNKCFLIISIIAGTVLLYSRCIDATKPVADARGNEYAGASACLQCHKDVYNNYLHTAHFKTSWAEKNVQEKGAGSAGHFVFNEHTAVAIEKRDSGLYQVAYVNGEESIAKRLDIGFGSGANAYSFGYWQDKRLYQLPLSYFTAIHGWANSPGFPAHRANFQRLIIRRCFECHSSYIAEDTAQGEGITQVRKLDKNAIIYGIDCQRCHGPAAEHVAFHTANPLVKDARYIARWASLSRQQKLDACGVCHSGNDLATQTSTFSFIPGDTLANFYYPEFAAVSSGVPDVHGKQVQLLADSRCFQKSKTMECASCHNVHEAKAPGIGGYSKQCIGCHNNTEHKDPSVQAFMSSSIVNNCIDCHMPKKASALISFQVMEKQNINAYLLRTHRIAVYPEETQKFIAQKKSAIGHQQPVIRKKTITH